MFTSKATQQQSSETKTYRARSMQEALDFVRRELGPDAAVLHTREVRGGLLGRMFGSRQVEVTASTSVNVPSLFPETSAPEASTTAETESDVHFDDGHSDESESQESRIPSVDGENFRTKFRDDLTQNFGSLHSRLEQLSSRSEDAASNALPESLFHLFTDLLDADVSEELARELIEKVRAGMSAGDLNDRVLLKARMARLVEDEISVCGPIHVTPGTQKVVALVGPTGVGKTTTIAKLAANFRLRERCNVGLITVDTYRIAAVEQLRTYADIIDLPMEVVATPKEMREAVQRLSHLDLILLDTAGRSPRDDVQIQELRSLLAEAHPDEVHLVLSSVAGAAGLKKAAAKFAHVGTTSIVLTKLDEAHGLGNLIPLLRSCRLPLSYLTNGQNVPDDIEQADPRELSHAILGMTA